MTEAMTLLATAGFAVIALSIAVFAGLRGWQGWLELKRLELAGHGAARSPAFERIEMADLKERIRKLETIAACVDL
jgi:hypothetical protein